MIRIEGAIGEGRATADAVARELERAGGEPVDIVLNSPGGSAFEGAAIHAELKAYRGRTTVRIRGIAASAASLVAMAGDVIVADGAAVLMLHDPAMMTVGDADAHRATAEVLDKLSEAYAKIYAEATGNRLADVRRWMADETWMTAEEAEILGFVDAIEDDQETRRQLATAA